MVTRTVICINSSETEQLAAIAAAANDNNNAAAIEKTENKQSELSKNTTSPAATLDQDREKRKRPLPLWRDNTNDQATMKRRRQQGNAFVIDLSDVPPQPPIPKSSTRVKEGASKYTGVTFNKQNNKWQALIMIEGKQRTIGLYDNEEEAAVDYARAVFKYKGGKVHRRQKKNSFVIDLSGVPPQPPIPRIGGREGASKYTGVTFNKQSNRWVAQIYLEGKLRYIGYYDDEEDAAIEYARAVFKYKREVKQQRKSFATTDLSDVPPQPPIPKSTGYVKEGASKYTGVTFNKQNNKWTAQIHLDGKLRYIGCYDDEEDAAIDYARAVFKYKGGVKNQK